MLLTLECPKCNSNDIARSRRKFWERFVLFVLKAQVYRCRDCRRRFWVGVEWGGVILVSMTLFVVACIGLTMVVVHRSQQQAAAAAAQAQALPKARKRRKLPPLPKGLPPLSSIPSTVSKGDEAADKGDEINTK